MSVNENSTVLEMLYEAYRAENQTEYEGIRATFDTLYESMNGMTIREMDRVIYPVCTLCEEHEKYGFIEGVRVGVQLARELAAELSSADSPMCFKRTNLPY